jgi:hypothetical protein
MTPFLLTLVALSTYRLTRLVTADRITQRIREWAIAKGEMVGYLATCDWCLSIWVAPVPSVLAIAFPENRLVLLAFVALSGSALTGLIATLESRLDR